MIKAILLCLSLLNMLLLASICEDEHWLIAQVFFAFLTFIIIGSLGSTLVVDGMKLYYFESRWDKERIGSRVRVLTSGPTSSIPDRQVFRKLVKRSHHSIKMMPKSVLF